MDTRTGLEKALPGLIMAIILCGLVMAFLVGCTHQAQPFCLLRCMAVGRDVHQPIDDYQIRQLPPGYVQKG